MPSVSLASVTTAFKASDLDKNGKLDKSEIAKTSLNYLNSSKSSDQNLGSFFATFLQGGSDQKGLLPDDNKDGMVDLTEIGNLAKKSGSKTDIDSADFKSAFADRYVEGGQAIDINKLQNVASGNSTTNGNHYGHHHHRAQQGGYQGGYGNYGGYGNNASNQGSQMVQMMMQMMNLMMSAMFNGSNQR